MNPLQMVYKIPPILTNEKVKLSPLQTVDTKGTELMFDKCKVVDLEGIVLGAYDLTYHGSAGETGCALLYKGPNIRNCEGTSDIAIKQSESLKFAKSDGHYWGVRHAGSC